jgi:hypothetical protein
MERYKSYLKKKEFAFEISLPGIGLDCYRNWEILFMGSIIITTENPLSPP